LLKSPEKAGESKPAYSEERSQDGPSILDCEPAL